MGYDVKDLRVIQNRGEDRNGTSPEGMVYRLIRDWRNCYMLTIKKQNGLLVPCVQRTYPCHSWQCMQFMFYYFKR